MTTRETGTAALAALEEVLARYGADDARWPASERAALGSLVAADPAAARLLAEARALDRLLAGAASTVAPERLAALSDRIMAAAGGSEPAASADRRVVAFEPRRAAHRHVPLERRPLWQAASLLAASLALGVLLGVASPSVPGVSSIAERIGLGELAEVQGVLVDDDGDEETL
jgi:hypothetical protein